jgi:hypothetical protein
MSTTWKSRLGKLETLIKGSGNRAFEIATELREICNDKEFLAECNGSLDEVENKLSRFTDATGFHLTELVQMLDHFPNQADWKDGHLRHLHDETLKAIDRSAQQRVRRSTDDRKKDFSFQASTPEASRAVHASDPPTRHQPTIEEYDELERKYKASQAEIRRLREENEALLDRINQVAQLAKPVKVKAK